LFLEAAKILRSCDVICMGEINIIMPVFHPYAVFMHRSLTKRANVSAEAVGWKQENALDNLLQSWQVDYMKTYFHCCPKIVAIIVIRLECCLEKRRLHSLHYEANEAVCRNTSWMKGCTSPNNSVLLITLRQRTSGSSLS